MRSTLSAALALTLGVATLTAAEADKKKAAGKAGTVKLFNGKDLEGWEGNENLWSVKDGVIVGKNTDPVPVSTYLVTKDKFRDFRLLATVKLVDGGPGDMHSGIAVWGRLAPEKGDKYTYMGPLVMFPSGWGMYDLHRRNGLPVDPGPAKKAGKQKDWNEMEILAVGDRLQVAVNGQKVVDYREKMPDLIMEGPIGLQLHSNKAPQEIHFKDLVIEKNPKDEKLKTVKE